MNNLPIAISLLAFAVSVVGLTISLLGYLRDRGRVRAWSSITWQENGPEAETPMMQVFVANVGRRPVMVLNLVKQSDKSSWSRSIQEPTLDAEVIGTIEQIKELKRRSLAHLVACKLAEGEILELRFYPEDCGEFYALHEEPIAYAKCLKIEDVAGTLYPVKNAPKNLATLINARSR